MGPCKSKIKNEKSCDTLQICFLILDLKGGKSIDECYTINESKCKIGKNKFKDICQKYITQNKEKVFTNDELVKIHSKIFL
jgi:hypothetical protein